MQRLEANGRIGLEDFSQAGDIDVHTPADEVPGVSPDQPPNQIALCRSALPMNEQFEHLSLIHI